MPRDCVPIDEAADAIPPRTDRQGRQRPQLRPPQRRVKGKFASEHGNDAPPPPHPPPPDDPNSPGSDRLEGAKAIARFYYDSDEEWAVKKVHHAKATKSLPIGTEGRIYVASKAKLRAKWDEDTSNNTDD